MSPSSPLLTWAARPLYWLLLAAALWLLLRGHNEPGGGFIAGLVAVAASSLLALTLDVAAARRWQPLAPLPLAMLGVGLAALAGLPGVLGGQPFLTHLWLETTALSTVLIFDLGVLCAVWGALTGYLYPLLDSQPMDDQPLDKHQRNEHPLDERPLDNHPRPQQVLDERPLDNHPRDKHPRDDHPAPHNSSLSDHSLIDQPPVGQREEAP